VGGNEIFHYEGTVDFFLLGGYNGLFFYYEGTMDFSL